MARPVPVTPGPGQESVWDYPRPPALRACPHRVRIVHAGRVVADSTDAVKVCETSQLPAYYVPARDVRVEWLAHSPQRSFCEWKGDASYWSLALPDAPVVHDVAWSYERPTAPYAAIAGHLAFYARLLDECWVGERRVEPNPGSFYGGWYTSDVVGPFKGEPGSSWW